MKLCVVAGMIDAKLASKLAPLSAIPEVTSIDLIRRLPFSGDKITCHHPPVSWLPVAELWKIIALFMITLFRRPDILVAFGARTNGIYAWCIGSLFGIPVVQHVLGKNDLFCAYAFCF